MDPFHFSTVFMAILTSNILLVVIAIILRYEKIMTKTGYKLVIFFLALTVARFMLPIEVPFATTFPLPKGISSIIVEIFAPRITASYLDISILHLILLVWFAGIAYQVYKFLETDRMIRLFIFTFGRKVNKDPRYAAIMQEICTDRFRSSLFQIFEVHEIQTPCIYGFRTPYILVPADLKCSDKELSYILQHETQHYMHHDLWIKFGIQLISIIYWWNPCGSLLNDHINLVLEMRIDSNITGEDKKERLEYMNCLYEAAKFQNTVLNSKLGNVIAFSAKDDTDSQRRMRMLTQQNTKKNPVLKLSLIGIICSIYVLSYLVIFEAYTDIERNAFNITMINSYLIDNSDGTYDLYLSGYKIETIDSLEFYSDDIPVFTREEFERVQPKTAE